MGSNATDAAEPLRIPSGVAFAALPARVAGSLLTSGHLTTDEVDRDVGARSERYAGLTGYSSGPRRRAPATLLHTGDSTALFSGLRQLDDVAIEISVSRTATPRLLTRRMDELGARTQGLDMSDFEVMDPEADLGMRSPLVCLGLIQSEVQVRTIEPRRFAVRTTDPTIVAAVVPDL